MDLVMSEYHILKTGGEFDRIILNSNFNDSLLSAHSSNKHIRINTSDSEAEKIIKAPCHHHELMKI